VKISLIALGLVFFSSSSLRAEHVTQWSFEGDVISPSVGVGMAELLDGTTATFAAGNGGGRGWDSTTYAAQGTESGLPASGSWPGRLVSRMFRSLNYNRCPVS
jgi:hypothetical protein